MDNDPIGTAVRRTNREDRLGDQKVCVRCGESDPACLRKVKISMKLLEEHHVLGQNHDSEITVTLCRNCHVKTHEEYQQEGVDLVSQPTFLERLLQMLRSLAAFFRMLGEALSDWAKEVERLIKRLDEGWPQWRTIG